MTVITATERVAAYNAARPRCGSIGPEWFGHPVCEHPVGHMGCCAYTHTPENSASHVHSSDYKWYSPNAVPDEAAHAERMRIARQGPVSV
jgi:hypothetical protein